MTYISPELPFLKTYLEESSEPVPPLVDLQSQTHSHDIAIQDLDPMELYATIPSDDDDTWLEVMYLITQNHHCTEPSFVKILFDKFLNSFNNEQTEVEQIINRIGRLLESKNENNLASAVALTFQVCRYLEHSNANIERVTYPSCKSLLILDLPIKMQRIWTEILKKYSQETSNESQKLSHSIASMLSKGNISLAQMESILQMVGMLSLKFKNQQPLGGMQSSLCALKDLHGKCVQGIKIETMEKGKRYRYLLTLNFPNAFENYQKHILSIDKQAVRHFCQAFGAICSASPFKNELLENERAPVSISWISHYMYPIRQLMGICLEPSSSDATYIGYMLLCFEHNLQNGNGDLPVTNTAILNFARAYSNASTQALRSSLLKSFKTLLITGSTGLSPTVVEREFTGIVNGENDDEFKKEWSIIYPLAKALALHHENYANQLSIQLWMDYAQRWGETKKDEFRQLGLDIMSWLPKSPFLPRYRMTNALHENKMLNFPAFCQYLSVCKKWKSYYGKSPERTLSNLASLQKMACHVLDTETNPRKKEISAIAPLLYRLISILFARNQFDLARELLKKSWTILLQSDPEKLARLFVERKDQLVGDDWNIEAKALADSTVLNQQPCKEDESKAVLALQLAAAYGINNATFWINTLTIASRCKNPFKLQAVEEFLKHRLNLMEESKNGAAQCWRAAFDLLKKVKQTKETEAIWLDILEHPSSFSPCFSSDGKEIKNVRSETYKLIVGACAPLVKTMAVKDPTRAAVCVNTLFEVNRDIIGDNISLDIQLLDLLLALYFSNNRPKNVLDSIVELSENIEKDSLTCGSTHLPALQRLFEIVNSLSGQQPLKNERERLLGTVMRLVAKFDGDNIDHRSYLNIEALIRPFITINAWSLRGKLLLKAHEAWRRTHTKSKEKLDLSKEWMDILSKLLNLKTADACTKGAGFLEVQNVSQQLTQEQLSNFYKLILDNMLMTLEKEDSANITIESVTPLLKKAEAYYEQYQSDTTFFHKLISRMANLSQNISQHADKGPVIKGILQKCEILLEKKLMHDISQACMQPKIEFLLDLDYIKKMFEALKPDNPYAEYFFNSGEKRLNHVCSLKFLLKSLKTPSIACLGIITLVDQYIFEASPVRWRGVAKENVNGEDLENHGEQSASFFLSCQELDLYKFTPQVYCVHYQYMDLSWPDIPLTTGKNLRGLYDKLMTRLINLGNACFIKEAFELFARSQNLLCVNTDTAVTEYDKLLAICEANPVRMIGNMTVLELAFQTLIDAEAQASFFDLPGKDPGNPRILMFHQFISLIGRLVVNENRKNPPDLALQLELIRRAYEYFERAIDERLFSNTQTKRTIALYETLYSLLQYINDSENTATAPQTTKSLLSVLDKALKLDIKDPITFKACLRVLIRASAGVPLPTSPANQEIFNNYLTVLQGFKKYDEFQLIFANFTSSCFAALLTKSLLQPELIQKIEQMWKSAGLVIPFQLHPASLFVDEDDDSSSQSTQVKEDFIPIDDDDDNEDAADTPVLSDDNDSDDNKTELKKR